MKKGNVSKRYISMTGKHMKKCSQAFVIREIQIKKTMKYHLTPERIAYITKPENYQCKGIWRKLKWEYQ